MSKINDMPKKWVFNCKDDIPVEVTTNIVIDLAHAIRNIPATAKTTLEEYISDATILSAARSIVDTCIALLRTVLGIDSNTPVFVTADCIFAFRKEAFMNLGNT